jgi:hypothetical protein
MHLVLLMIKCTNHANQCWHSIISYEITNFLENISYVGYHLLMRLFRLSQSLLIVPSHLLSSKLS